MKRHKYLPQDSCAVKLLIVASKLKLNGFVPGMLYG